MSTDRTPTTDPDLHPDAPWCCAGCGYPPDACGCGKDETPTQPTDWPPEQLERARQLAPQMVEVLAGWINLEGSLAAMDIGFRERLKSVKRMREVFRDANRLVQQVIEGSST